MELNLILSFLGAAVLLTLMPGPDNIFVLTQSITRGAKTGILISIGLVSGVWVHTAIAATGLSVLLRQSELVYSLILYLGAAYLFYLAFQATKEEPVETGSAETLSKTTKGFNLVRTGFFMNVLNPKVTLFFVAFLPQFITQNGWSLAKQFGVLGLLFIVQAFIIFSLISVLAGQLTDYFNSPKFWQITKWSKVVILALLGVFLLI